MPPPLMAFLCVVGIVGLFVLDRDNGPRPSKALWIPVAWLFINCSRPVSLWLHAFGLRGYSTVNARPNLSRRKSCRRRRVFVPVDCGVHRSCPQNPAGSRRYLAG